MKNLLSIIALSLFVAAPALAQGIKPEDITWKTPANNYRQYKGEKFSYRCPAGGTVSEQLWGTDTYSDDSSICTAAAHMGIITPSAGGVVTIEIRPGQNSYQGSKRNGIESESYESWMGSFVFVNNEGGNTENPATEASTNADDKDAIQIKWSTNSRQIGSIAGKRYKLRCPEEGDVNHRVWGTDIYTDDSSVCVAAIHSGLISTGGGVVTIEIRPGEKKYTGSRRNKVISENYGSWTSSFVFIK